jgi:hypothetical protein
MSFLTLVEKRNLHMLEKNSVDGIFSAITIIMVVLIIVLML